MPTYGCGSFDLSHPNPEDIDIRDIAHSLSNTCRFNGHTVQHYSVAQHSILVSLLCPHEFRFQGLMHDAHETYMGDITPQVKWFAPDVFRHLDVTIQATIESKFGFSFIGSEIEVKEADDKALRWEFECFVAGDHNDWCNANLPPLTTRDRMILRENSVHSSQCLLPVHAAIGFMSLFDDLYSLR